MAGEWQMDLLGDLLDVKHGFAFKGDFIHDEPRGDVLLTPGNFAIGGGFKGDKFKYYDGSVPDEFALQEGDLLVTMTDLSKQADTLGYPAFVPSSPDGRRYLHNQRLGKVLLKDPAAVDARYLYYVMCGQDYRHEILASATGTTVKHTAPERIRRFRFLRAPLEEQRAIAKILGTLDDKIELNRRMSETLEAIARTLYKSWFVDFDPVRTKAGGRDPGLPKPLDDLFADSFEDSELGKVPKGWGVRRISDVCEVIFSGGTPSTSSPNYWGGTVPWLSSGETRAKFIIATEKTITPSGVANSSTRRARAGATVIASAGQGNTRGQTSMLMLDSYINQSVVALLADLDQTSDTHLFFDLERRYEEFRRISDGHSSRGSLTTKLIGGLHFVVPPRRLVAAFDQIASPIARRIAEGLGQSRILTALRDTLLPKLVSGDLRVRAAVLHVA